MRSHAQVIGDEKGVAALAALLSIDSPHTVRAWRTRNSIPAQHWKRIADAEIATLDELAGAAADRIAA